MIVLYKYFVLAGILSFAVLLTANGAAVQDSKKAQPDKKSEGIRRTSAAKQIESNAAQERKMEIFEHAAANRELAALTQVEHAREMEQKASDIENSPDDETNNWKKRFSRSGIMRQSAAELYGQAVANFDKAAANRTMVAKIGKTIGKTAQLQKSESYAENMKAQGSEAMRLAACACEAAAVAFDKAERPTDVAANSQMAAVWLEKLALR